MASRLDLQIQLETLLGNSNVYFQPPASVKMKYPAIVYALEDIENKYADDGVYLSHRCYSVTLIDYDPDSSFVHSLAELRTCRFNRYYTKDNLNHWNFSIYY